MASLVGQEHHGAAAKHIPDMLGGDAHQVLWAATVGKLTAHGVKLSRASLSLTSTLGLLIDLHSQRTDHDGNQQHDCEGDNVLCIANDKSQVRWNEEEVESRHTQH